MKIRCLIVDDEPLARKGIINYISKIPGAELVAAVNNATKAREVLLTKRVDLMFLDINMPGNNGLDFINELDDNPPLSIVVTAYTEYALQGFDLNVVDYFVKPVSFERFYKAFVKAEKLLNQSVYDVKDITNESFFY